LDNRSSGLARNLRFFLQYLSSKLPTPVEKSAGAFAWPLRLHGVGFGPRPFCYNFLDHGPPYRISQKNCLPLDSSLCYD
jgi:hypothetical protein